MKFLAQDVHDLCHAFRTVYGKAVKIRAANQHRFGAERQRVDGSGKRVETAAMGIDLLTEAQYGELQKLGEFDTKTSSWVNTPAQIRELGGALYCDRRYGRVFVGHNGAQSYYSAGRSVARSGSNRNVAVTPGLPLPAR